MPVTGETRFGYVYGPKDAMPIPMGASEVLKTKSGRFVINDGSGRGEIADDGDKSLMGHVESGDLTCSATEGATRENCITNPNAVFKCPFIYDGATYTQNYSDTLLNTFVDLEVVSNIQFVNLTTSDDDLLKVVGGRAATAVATAGSFNDGFVLVKMNPAILDN